MAQELSRENEPPVGTWVKDRHGATSLRYKEGWGAPGIMPFGVWRAMWDARGPYTICGPWGAPLADTVESLQKKAQIREELHAEILKLAEEAGRWSYLTTLGGNGLSKSQENYARRQWRTAINSLADIIPEED